MWVHQAVPYLPEGTSCYNKTEPTLSTSCRYVCQVESGCVSSLLYCYNHLLVGENSEEKVLASLLEAIAQLPPSNKDTLAFLILHLQK